MRDNYASTGCDEIAIWYDIFLENRREYGRIANKTHAQGAAPITDLNEGAEENSNIVRIGRIMSAMREIAGNRCDNGNYGGGGYKYIIWPYNNTCQEAGAGEEE